MSNLLDQAITEASALREAAYKSAEAAVIEKYSNQIQSAVEQILESGFDDFGDDLDDGEGGIADDAPTSADEKLVAKVCLVPEEGDEGEEDEEFLDEPDDSMVSLDLEKLTEVVNNLLESEDDLEDDFEEDFEEESDDEDASENENLEDEEELDESCSDKPMSEEDEDTDLVDESVNFDHEPVKSGWLADADSVIEEMEEELVASRTLNKERAEKQKKMSAAVKKLTKENKKLVKESLDRSKQFEKMVSTIAMMKEIIEESNVINAKLLYKVKTLEDNSLNERQKKRIVEKLSSVNSAEEAKIVYETLQSSIESSRSSRREESLNEVVQNKTSAVFSAISSRNDSSKPRLTESENQYASRWKELVKD